VLTGTSYRPVIVPFATAANTKARAINDAGVVVGTYTSQDCAIGCAFVATPTTTPPAICSQTVGMTYGSGTLTLNFTLRTTVATTWKSWLFVQGIPYQLWSLPLAPINPPASVSVPVTLGPVGSVILASILSTPTHGTICVDYATINTGGS
jgi:hypothetical protein